MNREIKFREFQTFQDGKTKMSYDTETNSAIGHTRGNLMQYTGLKDKNGKGIYEGDVVRKQEEWRGEDTTREYSVVWEDGIEADEYVTAHCGFRLKEAGKKNTTGFSSNPKEVAGYGMYGIPVHRLEVIGNIYEMGQELKNDRGDDSGKDEAILDDDL